MAESSRAMKYNNGGPRSSLATLSEDSKNSLTAAVELSSSKRPELNRRQSYTQSGSRRKSQVFINSGTSPYYSVHADHATFYASSVISGLSTSLRKGVGTHQQSPKSTGDGMASEDGKLNFFKMSSQRKYTLILLCVAYIGAGCGFSVPAPFFPREAGLKGASTTIVGLVFSVFQLVSFVSCPILGSVLAHVGAKFMYVTGLFIAGTTAILFGFLDKSPAGTPFIVLSFVVRSVEAFGIACFFVAGTAVVINEFPQNIGSVFAILETCIGVGMMVGPTIGGALYEVGGFGAPFWAVGAIILTAGSCVLFFLPEPDTNGETGKGSVLVLLRSFRVWVSLLCVMCGSSGIGFLDPTLAQHFEQYGLSTLEVGLCFVIVPGLHALASPLWGWISDRKKIQAPLMILGSFLCVVSFLLLGPTPLIPFLPQELWLVILALALFGLSLGCCIVPTMASLVIGARELRLPDDLNTFGLVSGLFQSVFSLGAFFGPTVGGILVDQVGFEYSATVMSAFFIFAMAMGVIYFGGKRLLARHRRAEFENETTPLTLSSSQSSNKSCY